MERVFNTAYRNSYDPPEDPKDATRYDGHAELTFITGNKAGFTEKEQEILCIYVNGACNNDGYSNIRVSAGVYFGPQSRYNWSGVLDRNVHLQTSQSAETFAMIRALRIFSQNRSEYHWNEIRTIVIVTDSDYAFQGITGLVSKWRSNGYRNCRGDAVVNGDKFRHLDSLVMELEVDGFDVLFWKVDREFNQEAGELARSEL